MSTETHLDRLWDRLQIDHFSALAETYYADFRVLLAAELAKVPTSVFITIILSICVPPLVALFFYEQHCSKTSAAKPQGCKKLGMKIESNLSNEFDANFSKGRPASTEETSAEWWRVKSMWIYPVKSCKGVELNHASIVSAGMEYDRQFTFAQLKKPVSPVLAPAAGVDGVKPKPKHKWEFITQRQFPKLANVKTQMWVPDFNSPSYRPHDDDVEAGGVVIISFPYQEAGLKGLVAALGAKLTGNVPEMEFRVPFNPTPAQVEKAGYSVEECTIWKDRVPALNMEIEIPDELRYYLGMSNKLGLFRIDNSNLREVHGCAPKAEDIGFQPVTGFQDSYPLHLINLASVRDVERQMPKTTDTLRLSAQRFRPNIISKLSLTFHSPRQKTSNTFCSHWPRSIRRRILEKDQDRLLRIRRLLPHRALQDAKRRSKQRRETPFTARQDASQLQKCGCWSAKSGMSWHAACAAEPDLRDEVWRGVDGIGTWRACFCPIVDSSKPFRAGLVRKLVMRGDWQFAYICCKRSRRIVQH